MNTTAKHGTWSNRLTIRQLHSIGMRTLATPAIILFCSLKEAFISDEPAAQPQYTSLLRTLWRKSGWRILFSELHLLWFEQLFNLEKGLQKLRGLLHDLGDWYKPFQSKAITARTSSDTQTTVSSWCWETYWQLQRCQKLMLILRLMHKRPGCGSLFLSKFCDLVSRPVFLR